MPLKARVDLDSPKFLNESHCTFIEDCERYVGVHMLGVGAHRMVGKIKRSAEIQISGPRRAVSVIFSLAFVFWE